MAENKTCKTCQFRGKAVTAYPCFDCHITPDGSLTMWTDTTPTIEAQRPIFVHQDFFIIDPYIVDNMLHLIYMYANSDCEKSNSDSVLCDKILGLFR